MAKFKTKYERTMIHAIMDAAKEKNWVQVRKLYFQLGTFFELEEQYHA